MGKIVTFSSFSRFPEIIHGISTREFGSIKEKGIVFSENLQAFSQALGIDDTKFAYTRQVHGSEIASIESVPDCVIDARDGLITDKKGIFLCVATADCLPILFYDPMKRVCGVVHAGWRGVSSQIIENMVAQFKDRGADTKKIIVGIGPSIGVCCYNVTKERADIFMKKFPQKKDIIRQKGTEIFLDLKQAAKEILLTAGIGNSNIEIMDYCTVDNNDMFFSFRKDSDETFGGFITMIGRR